MHVLRTKIIRVSLVFKSLKDETPLVFSILGAEGCRTLVFADTQQEAAELALLLG